MRHRDRPEAPLNTLVGLLVSQDWGFNGWTLLLLSAEALAVLTLPSVLLQRRGQPLSALSWFLALVAVPFLGVLAWWGLGRSHLRRKRRKRRKAHRQVRGRFSALAGVGSQRGADVPFAFRHLPKEGADGIFPPVPGNRIRVLSEGDSAFSAIGELASQANHHLHFLFYIWNRDTTGARFRDLLAEKARSGIEVRVLLDALGSAGTAGRFMDPLREAGAKVALFNPTRFLRRSLSVNFRNHRKIAVADGCAAYTGGFNIGDEYAWKWRDAGLILRGPAVAQLQEVFADDWFFSTGEDLASEKYLGTTCPVVRDSGEEATCAIVAGGPDAEQNITQDAFLLAVAEARHRLWITTPYLIPAPPIQSALRTAVHRGVDVRLLVPHTSDQPLTAMAGRSYYPTLLASGVRIFEYRPAMLHSKVWVVDRETSAVGTANLDTRSFKLNFEACCFVQSAAVNERLAHLFAEGVAKSEQVSERDLSRRGKAAQLAEAAMNLLSPLL